jgi:Skp family chaperone for outer membrane proteins
VLLILGALFLAGRSWSDTKPPASPPRTRVGLVNLSHAIKSYDKFKFYQEDVKTALKPYQEREAELKKKGDALAEEVKSPETAADRKPALQKKLLGLQREMEDNKAEAQRIIAEKQNKQLKVLYQDVEKVVRRYAKARGFDLVLHYNDLVKEEAYTTENILRKMQAGACMPLYTAPGIDITDEVMTALNEDFRSRKDD